MSHAVEEITNTAQKHGTRAAELVYAGTLFAELGAQLEKYGQHEAVREGEQRRPKESDLIGTALKVRNEGREVGMRGVITHYRVETNTEMEENEDSRPEGGKEGS